MFRNNVAPRDNFKKKLEEKGLLWNDKYWTDDTYYSFTMREIEEIEKASEEVHQLFVQAGDYIIDNNLFYRFNIPEEFIPEIINTWNNDITGLNYGRFDFGYDGINPPKLFEYNCDTPTSLLEASVIQWDWKEEVFPDKDQFNNIHDELVKRYASLGVHNMHFAYADDNVGEDVITVSYHMDCAAEAGIEPNLININDIGWCNLTNRFVDLENSNIDNLFHLYPWEWIVNEQFGKNILKNTQTDWYEPIWKMIWSNKAILPILWEMFPDHPNLLASSFDPIVGEHVTKPILSREGANVTINSFEGTVSSDGEYDDGNIIYQKLYKLPKFGTKYPVIGSWCIDGYSVGMGIREDGLITGNTACFVPHIIEG